MQMNPSREDNSGLKRLLTFSRLYESFQTHILGGKQARMWLTKNLWKLESGDTVVDIGCGSATVLEYMPSDIAYYGVDISENYIKTAREKFSTRGSFFLGTARVLIDNSSLRGTKADLVLCNGLLHHLPDDEATEVLELGKQLLKPEGRLVCLEATFLMRQTRLSRRMVSMDRGKYVRSEQEWKNLIAKAFDSYSTHVLTGLIRIPYTHIIIECFNDNGVSLK